MSSRPDPKFLFPFSLNLPKPVSALCCLDFLCFRSPSISRASTHMKRVFLLFLIIKLLLRQNADTFLEQFILASEFVQQTVSRFLLFVPGGVFNFTSISCLAWIISDKFREKCWIWLFGVTNRFQSRKQTNFRFYCFVSSLEVRAMLSASPSKPSSRRPSSMRRRTLLRNHLSCSLERLPPNRE